MQEPAVWDLEPANHSLQPAISLAGVRCRAGCNAAAGLDVQNKPNVVRWRFRRTWFRRRRRRRGLRPHSSSFFSVQRPHHPDPRKHQPAAACLRGVDQVLDRNLPELLLLHIFRQLHDVVGGVLQGRERATPAQAYRRIERRRPRHLRPGDALVAKSGGICPESSGAAAKARAFNRPFSTGRAGAPASPPASALAPSLLPWRCACR